MFTAGTALANGFILINSVLSDLSIYVRLSAKSTCAT